MLSSETKPFLLITGMHRSGTSFLARALNLGGVYLGDLSMLISHELEPLSDNLRGHWEHRELLELAELSLSQNNGSWDDVPTSIKIDENIGSKIYLETQDLVNHPSLASGFKDPRIILCLEVWQKYLPNNFVIIGIFRNPLEVAESLKLRNGFDYEKSLDLWRIYNEKLLSMLDKFDGFLLNFNWSKERILTEISLIFKKIGLPDSDISEWYSEDLFHNNKFQESYPQDNTITDLYDKLLQRTQRNNQIESMVFSNDKNNLLNALRGSLLDLSTQTKFFKQTQKIQLNEHNKTISKLESIIQEKQKQINDLDDMIKSQLNEKNTVINSLEVIIQEKQKQIIDLEETKKNTAK
jgi:hypothetical protein